MNCNIKSTDQLNELALFGGAGGGILGGHLLGWRCVCAVECDACAAGVMCARQNDGHLPPFPIWDDVRTFDGKPWRGIVDVVSGGFPCQDISVAGKGAGLSGERSGLWAEMARIIGEVRPRFAFVENSPALTNRGLGTVLGDLAEMGYDARWGVLGACDARAPHKRERIWIVATDARHGPKSERAWGPRGEAGERAAIGREPKCDGKARDVADAHSLRELQSERIKPAERRRIGNGGQEIPDADLPRCHEQRRAVADAAPHPTSERGDWWRVEPDVGRVADGVAARVDRLKAIGNGQVPSVAKLAWEILTSDLR